MNPEEKRLNYTGLSSYQDGVLNPASKYLPGLQNNHINYLEKKNFHRG
jgi:hypothetical protein